MGAIERAPGKAKRISPGRTEESFRNAIFANWSHVRRLNGTHPPNHPARVPFMEAAQPFSVLIACPGCKRAGSALWQDFDRPVSVGGTLPAQVKLTAGFLQEAGKTRSGDPIIACD